MTPEKQRSAIAEACGWTNLHQSIKRGYGLRPGNNGMGDMPGEAIPDYLSNLNAMHDAEKVLTREQRVIYAARLHPKGLHPYLLADFLVCHATAAQRAEAFLRTLGLWTE